MPLTGWRALVLAAGAGRRFGGAKLLAPLAGAPVIRRTLEAVAAAGFDDLVVVTGAHSAEIARALAGLDCRMVEAEDWDQGMAASIRAGCSAFADTGAGLFLFLGDMPLVPVDMCAELAERAQASGFAARPRVQGRPGHPVAFSRAALPMLMALEGDAGAGELLRRRRDDTAYLETDDIGAVLDIDDADGLALAERLWNSRATSATTESAISRGALPKP